MLSDTYDRIGFGVVGDEVFKQVVLTRLIEPTSKADTIRVLDEVGSRGAEPAVDLADPSHVSEAGLA